MLLMIALLAAACAIPTALAADDTIEFWHLGTDDPDKSMWGYAVDQFDANDADLGFKVEQVATVNDQYKQKLAVAMASGQCPDIYIHWTGGPLVEYINSGYAQDITALVDQYGLRDLYTAGSLAQTGCQLHPGAARYYEEMGYAFN